MVVSQYFGVGERTREGNDLYYEMRDSGVIKTMVFGQMNEPPGARMRVALSALTMVSISVMNKDKTFCYSSITFSDLLKQVQKYRIIGTYAVGYQPTLATEMGQLQERITSTNKGSVTSIQAVFVPTDDYTDPNCIRSLRCYN